MGEGDRKRSAAVEGESRVEFLGALSLRGLSAFPPSLLPNARLAPHLARSTGEETQFARWRGSCTSSIRRTGDATASPNSIFDLNQCSPRGKPVSFETTCWREARARIRVLRLSSRS